MKRWAVIGILGISFSAFAQSQPINQEHVQYWIKTLESHPLVLIRKQAARHLGNMHESSALPTLVKALSDTSEDVRIQAAYSIGRLGDPSALRPLYELIEESNSPQVTAAAKNAIEKINAHEQFLHDQKQKQKSQN